MGHYIARRVLLIIPTFFLATSMAFFMLRILPGDELTLIIGEETITRKTDPGWRLATAWMRRCTSATATSCTGSCRVIWAARSSTAAPSWAS